MNESTPPGEASPPVTGPEISVPAELTLSLERSQQRLRELQSVHGSAPLDPAASAAVEELGTVLEELRVTTEELRAQNVELADSASALAAERRRYRDLFEQMPDGYVVTDELGVIEELNAAAASLMGGPARSLRGKPIRVYLLDARRAFASAAAPDADVNTPAAPHIQEWESILRARDGRQVPVAVRAARVRRAGRESIRWLLRDLSDRQRAEERTRWLVHEQSARQVAERAERDASFLAAASRALVVQPELRTALMQLAASVTEFVAELCMIDVLPRDGPVVRIVAHLRDAERAAALGRLTPDMGGDSDAARVLRSGESCLATAVVRPEELNFPAEERALLWDLAVRSYAIVPLWGGGEIRGLMTVGSADSLEARLVLVHELADRVGLAIERDRLQRLADAARADLEVRVAERTAELERTNVQLAGEVEERRRWEAARTTLLRRLVSAEEEERARISRELHDELGQLATGLQLALRALREQLADRPGLVRRLDALETLAEQIGSGAQHLAKVLRPPALDRLGLHVALENYLLEWRARSGIALDYQVVGPMQPRLGGEIESTLYRVVQEGLTNVLRHARATRASLVLERRAGHVAVILEDDGRGFDPEQLEESPRQGLRGMRERITMLGGSLTVQSSPGTGTTIFARLPDGRAEEPARS